jgi:SAM-dependent methyltransferase
VRLSYHCIVAIATLHHLPLAPLLTQLRDALRPGGALLVLDLYADASWRDRLHHLAAAPVSLALRLRRSRSRSSHAERAAWAAHDQHDAYPTLDEVRAAAAATIPGARLHRHLLWRYALTWAKPD